MPSRALDRASALGYCGRVGTLPLVLLTSALVTLTGPHRTTATRYADSRRDEGGTPACWRRCLTLRVGRMRVDWWAVGR